MNKILEIQNWWILFVYHYNKIILFYMYGCFAFTYVFALHVPMEARRGHQIPCSWLRAT